MAEQPKEMQESAQDPQSHEIADRTAATAGDERDVQEPSKSALKRAAKQEKLAAEKANKSTTNTTKDIGKPEARKAVNKAPKKKIDGAALIGIDVAKEDDFAGWYQQVLTKGDMLDYYDVSGCYILKVSYLAIFNRSVYVTFCSQRLISFGRKSKIGSTRRSRALGSEIVHSRCLCHKMF